MCNLYEQSWRDDVPPIRLYLGRRFLIELICIQTWATYVNTSIIWWDSVIVLMLHYFLKYLRTPSDAEFNW